MESLIDTFHVDLKLLIAQAVNFAIVFGVLYYFALRPLLGVMRERTEKIEKSLTDASQIEKNLERTKNEYEHEMAEAKKKANDIIEAAKETAEMKKKEIVASSKAEVSVLIEQEKAKMQQEKAKILREIKVEMADLISASVEKILEKKMDSKSDKELIAKITKVK